ncbi:MAG: hypothetical protein Q8Q20_04115 [bacterium]|nr:hypothetical protein [bacterium]
MKKEFQYAVSSKYFDAALGFILLLIVTLSFDFAIDEALSAQSMAIDALSSLVLAVVIALRPTSKDTGTDPAIVRKRSETFEFIGKMLIGFLLFMSFVVLLIIN